MWSTSRDEFVTGVINLAGKFSILSRASPILYKIKFYLRKIVDKLNIKTFARMELPKT